MDPLTILKDDELVGDLLRELERYGVDLNQDIDVLLQMARVIIPAPLDGTYDLRSA